MPATISRDEATASAAAASSLARAVAASGGVPTGPGSVPFAATGGVSGASCGPVSSAVAAEEARALLATHNAMHLGVPASPILAPEQNHMEIGTMKAIHPRGGSSGEDSASETRKQKSKRRGNSVTSSSVPLLSASTTPLDSQSSFPLGQDDPSLSQVDKEAANLREKKAAAAPASQTDVAPNSMQDIKTYAAAMVVEGLKKAQLEAAAETTKIHTALIDQLSEASRKESQSIINHCMEGVCTRLSKVETSCTNTEAAVSDLGSKFDALKVQQDSFNDKLDRLLMRSSASAPSLAAAGGAHPTSRQPPQAHVQVVASPFTNPNFNRVPDPTKIFVNIGDKHQVPIAAFVKAFSALAEEANIGADQYQIVGDQLDQRFEVQFTADTDSATRCCASFLSSLSLGGGKYKEQYVVVDDAGTQYQFYCNPDKNLAQVRKEILTRNLKELLEPHAKSLGKIIAMRKTTGSVLIDRRVVGSIFLLNEKNARIQWYTPVVLSLNIDMPSIDEAFSAVAGGQPCP